MLVVLSPSEARSAWWLVLIRGIIALAFGIATLVWPEITLLALVLLLGIFLVIDGIIEIVQAISDRRSGGSLWWIVPGILAVAAGVITLVWPHITAVTLLYVFAFWSVIVGVLAIIAAFGMRRAKVSHWAWVLIWGILLLILGIWLFIRPSHGLLGFTWLLGIWAIVVGIIEIVGAFWVRSAVKETPA
jgi:uncharacterized membrane protein HdeD (DUF308 family)